MHKSRTGPCVGCPPAFSVSGPGVAGGSPMEPAGINGAVAGVARLPMAPRFIEVIRISPMTFRSIDVGVVLDMMIHDIDIVLHLVQQDVRKADAVGVNVLGPHEDICNVRVTFAGGAVANMTGSRLALKTERKLRVFRGWRQELLGERLLEMLG